MIRIGLADDHLIVRQGLKQILSDQEDLAVVGEAANGAETLQLVRDTAFDVLILDLSMPGRSGVELIKLIKAEKPKLAILVLSMHKEEQYAVRAIKAGAAGYLTKESASDQLVSAIRRVASGRAFVTPAVAEWMILDFGAPSEGPSHTQLSDREFQIFQMIVSGMNVTAIADALCLSVKTVSTHKARILQKMHMSNSAELIHYAIEHGLRP
ncbi:MAG: DNA-binding response regulator [Rhodocyclaceae bacterium]|nr:DNA-binding response regulator [Rhodocyclaceae bacterium]